MAIDEWCMVYQSEVGSLYKYIVHLSVGLIIMYTTDYLHVYHWVMIAYILCNFGSIKGLDFYIYICILYIWINLPFFALFIFWVLNFLCWQRDSLWRSIMALHGRDNHEDLVSTIFSLPQTTAGG